MHNVNNVAPTVGWDADGVLIDSRAVAFNVAEDVVRLFGHQVQITSRDAYNAAFGTEAQKRLVGEENTATLRAMHRLLMRARAGEVGIFTNCLAVIRQMRERPLVITAAYGAGIKHALGDNARFFLDIRGRESGRKEALLERAVAAGLKFYVTDTVRDITRCRDCGITVIAVAWGYDPLERLVHANPDFIAEDTVALTKVLNSFSLLSMNGGPDEES